MPTSLYVVIGVSALQRAGRNARERPALRRRRALAYSELGMAGAVGRVLNGDGVDRAFRRSTALWARARSPGRGRAPIIVKISVPIARRGSTSGNASPCSSITSPPDRHDRDEPARPIDRLPHLGAGHVALRDLPGLGFAREPTIAMPAAASSPPGARHPRPVRSCWSESDDRAFTFRESNIRRRSIRRRRSRPGRRDNHGPTDLFFGVGIVALILSFERPVTMNATSQSDESAAVDRASAIDCERVHHPPDDDVLLERAVARLSVRDCRPEAQPLLPPHARSRCRGRRRRRRRSRCGGSGRPFKSPRTF